MMTDEMQVALVKGAFSVGGVIIGALLTIFRHDIARLFGRIRNDDLKGRWKCVWNVKRESGEVERLEDYVEITKINGKYIRGRSDGTPSADFGSYKIEGRNNPFSICFSYFGTGKARNLFGVALLKRGPYPSTMEGNWWQITHENEIVGGTTVWEKEG
ncbi:MAG: hypothetical protein JSV33_04185 [bacterium]|nr:MAG: hypothetical protein JSV33_04185 [bacterium]